MRRGWLYGLVCTVLVSTQSSYARSVNAGALGDECECRSGWQRNRTYVHCPLPDRGPRDCPSDRLIVSVYPIPVDDSIGVPGIRKISL